MLLQQAPVIIPVVIRYQREQTIFKSVKSIASARNGESNTDTDILSCAEQLLIIISARCRLQISKSYFLKPFPRSNV